MLSIYDQLTYATYKISNNNAYAGAHNDTNFTCLTYLTDVSERHLNWYETYNSTIGGNITFAKTTESVFGQDFRITYMKPMPKVTNNHYQNFFTFGNEFYDGIVKTRIIKCYDGICLSDKSFNIGILLTNYKKTEQYVHDVLKCMTLLGVLRSEMAIFDFNDACYDILGISLTNPLCILDNEFIDNTTYQSI